MFKARRDKLTKVLDLVSKATSRRTHDLQLLKGMRLEVKGNVANFSATNNVVFASVSGMPVESDKDMDIVVAGADKLASYVRALTCKQVSFAKKRTQLLVGQVSTARFNFLSSLEFPTPEKGEVLATVSSTVGKLVGVLDKVSFFVEDDDSNPVMSGIHFDGDFLGSRPNRFALKKFQTDALEVKRPITFALGVCEPLKVLIDYLSPDKSIVMEVLSTNFVRFATENVVVMAKLLSGEFPSVTLRKVMSSSIEGKLLEITVSKAGLAEALSRMALFVGAERHLSMRYVKDETRLVMTTSDISSGEKAKEELDCMTTWRANLKGEKFGIVMDFAHVSEVLPRLAGESITFLFRSSSKPVVIQEEDYTYTFLPLLRRT